ncbi:MAG: putative metal-binding motif-containing protein [Deltaproteobacteria bacterium]|nr:putative metal-binding motif-containing protein [Deltaproteobacteria bacterium]
MSIAILLALGCGSNGSGQDADADDASGEDVQDDEDAAADSPDMDVVEDGPPGPCTGDESCDDDDPCTTDTCDLTEGECEHGSVDADDDGYFAMEVDGVDCGGTDCDDGNENIYPGADAVCDMVDDDCSGEWDDEAGADDDGDEYLDADCGGDDCDDGRGDVYPGAEPICLDGVDQDCDTVIDGALLADVRLTSAAGGSWSRQLVWSGSEFGVAWVDARDGDQDIYFVRVTADGTKIGSDVNVTDTTEYTSEVSIAWTGSEYVACWEDQRGSNVNIYCRRIGEDGSLPGTDTLVTSTANVARFPAVAWAGSQAGVIWEDLRSSYRDVYFHRLAADGSVTGSELRVTSYSANVYTPTLAWTGSEFGACWEDYRDSVSQIYCVRISASGTKIGSEANLSETTGYSDYPCMVWTGSEFGVSWNDNEIGNEEIYFARLGADGVKVGASTRLTSSTGSSEVPRLAWTGSGYVVSWTDDDTSDVRQAYVQHFNADASTLGSEVAVTSSTSNTYNPAIAWSGSVIGMTWDDFLVGNREVYFNLLGICE